MNYPIIINLLLGICFFCTSTVVIANQSKDETHRALIEQLKNLTLEDLIEVETFNPKASSAARKEQKLTDTAGALFVITQEDIRRSGITTLPEILRLVPGVQVARVNANRWAISIRGSNGLFASKLLVMIDGRSVYSLLRSEVNWEVQDVMLEDVERIEVIRGPGASLWGANAVNGIVNIITKSSEQTQGNLISLYAGTNEEKAIASFRHGGTFNDGNSHYRVYGKLYNHDNFITESGQKNYDQWEMHRSGFRTDTQIDTQESLTIQGDVYDGKTRQDVFLALPMPGMVQDDILLRGFNLLSRWEQTSESGDISLQAYYDRAQRDEITYNERRDNIDLDFQHRFLYSENQEYIWGLGYRFTHDKLEGTPTLSYTPDKKSDYLYSAFVQGEFRLPLDFLNISGETPQEPSDWIKLTVGSKFENYGASNTEVQPTLRVLWAANNQHSLWAAVSKAMRIPSRSDKDISFFLFYQVPEAGINGISHGIGNHDFQPEELIAYELGYRFYPNQKFLLDTNIFYHDYKQLRTIEITEFQPFLTLKADNLMYGEVYGLETALHWQLFDNFKLISTYSYLNTQLHLQTGSVDPYSELSEEGNNPHHQITLRTLIDLPHNMEFDTLWSYVDDVPSQQAYHYTRLDMRLGWKPTPHLSLSVGGRNLLNERHREFGIGVGGGIIFPSEVSRTWYLQLGYEF